MKWDAFIGGSYEASARTADMERTVNWYPEQLQSQAATSRAVLLPTPGVLTLSTSPVSALTSHQSPGRAHIVSMGQEYAVIGDLFVKIDSFGRRTYPSYPLTLAFDGHPATISSSGDGGNELFITSGGNGYVYDITAGTLAEIPALRGKATMGEFLEGYFLCLDANTATLYISDLYDGTTWDTGTNFAQRSLRADRWIGMKVAGRFVWLLGETTSEAWYNTGATFPFEPHPSGAIDYGIAAPFSAGLVGSDLVWLARTSTGRKCVVRAAGFTPEVVSTYPVETALWGYDNVEDAIADVYSERGHMFYLLHCDRQGATWAWDSETKIWCERGTWIDADGRYTAWRPRFYAYAFNQHRMLDGAGDALFQLSSDITTDVDGSQIRRLRRAPAPYDENRRIFYSVLELDLEPGIVGSLTADPQVMLRLSNDGGKTWICERWESAGKCGEYSRRVRWFQLGAARRRVFEVVVTDAAPWKLTGCYLEAAQEDGRA